MRTVVAAFVISAGVPAVAVRPAEGQHLPLHVLREAATARGPTLDTILQPADPAGALLGATVLGAMAFMVAWRLNMWEEALWAEAIGIGLGAHIGNRRRGNALGPLGASVGVLLVALAAGDEVDLPEGAILIVPMLQVFTAVWAETATARSRAGR